MSATVTYIHHSAFLVETPQAIVIFDYWQDPRQVLARRLEGDAKPTYFVVSHFHADHYNPAIFDLPTLFLSHGWAPPQYLLAYDAAKRRKAALAASQSTPQEAASQSTPQTVAQSAVPVPSYEVLRPADTYECPQFTLTAFRSTDTGVSFLLTTAEGERLFHAGDCNNWYFPPQEAGGHLKVTPAAMEGLFLAVVRDVAKAAPQGLAHLMFPVDPRLGAETLRGATQWLQRIPTAHFYPMHTWHAAEALPHCQRLQSQFPDLQVHTQYLEAEQ